VAKKAVWSSLTKEYGEKVLYVNVFSKRLEFVALALTMATVYGLAFLYKYGTDLAQLLCLPIIISFFFVFRFIYYRDYPSGRNFIIVYKDEFVINANRDTHGPGLVRLSRDEYWIDVLARDAEVYDLEKCGKVYTIVFNKPVRGTMFIRLWDDRFNVNDETLPSFIEAAKPRRVLINGLYYPHIYAIFKMFYGDEYPDLAEGLLRDFSDIIARVGLAKVSAVMNALRALCLANRKEEAVRLAKAIVTGEAFNCFDIIDEKAYMEQSYYGGPLCYSYAPDGRTKAERLDRALTKLLVFSSFAIASPAPFLVIAAAIFNWDLWSLLNMMVSTCGLMFGYGMVLSPMVFWSRASMRDGYGRMLFYPFLFIAIVFAAFIPLPYIYPPNIPYAWVLYGYGIFGAVITAISVMIRTGYFTYRIGLKQAKKLLSVLK